MTVAIIIIGIIVGLIWASTKILPMLSKTISNEAQASFLTQYLNYSMSPASRWIHDCKNKEELLFKGQERLWKTVAEFNDNMIVLADNEFKFKTGDTEMLEQALAIVGTVHLMHVAEKGDITFHKIEEPKDKE